MSLKPSKTKKTPVYTYTPDPPARNAVSELIIKGRTFEQAENEAGESFDQGSARAKDKDITEFLRKLDTLCSDKAVTERHQRLWDAGFTFDPNKRDWMQGKLALKSPEGRSKYPGLARMEDAFNRVGEVRKIVEGSRPIQSLGDAHLCALMAFDAGILWAEHEAKQKTGKQSKVENLRRLFIEALAAIEQRTQKAPEKIKSGEVYDWLIKHKKAAVCPLEKKSLQNEISDWRKTYFGKIP